MSNYIFSFLLLIGGHTLLAQSPELLWEKRLGNKGWDNAIYALTENMEGQIAFVGTTNSRYKKGKEAYFGIIDSGGNLQLEKQLGRRGNETAYSVQQTPDGGYILAGFSDSKANGHQGLKDAWLVKLDEQGEVLWDTLLGTTQDDVFYGLALDDAGTIYAVGQKDKAAWLVAFSPIGTFLWEKILTNTASSEARTIALTNTNELYIAGYQEDKSKIKGFLFKLKQQTIVWQKKWDDLKYMDMTILLNGNLGIGGIASLQREDMAYTEISPNGEIITNENYGGRGNDGALGLAMGWEQQKYLVGYTFSHIRAARREKLWIHALDKKSQKIWEKEQYFGGEFRDGGHDIVQNSQGAIYLGGVTHSNNLTATDAWLLKLKGDTIPQLPNSPQLVLKNLGFTNLQGNDALLPKNRSYYALKIKNSGTQNAYAITANLQNNTSQKGITFLEKIHIGFLAAGTEKIVYFPVNASENIQSGTNEFVYSLEAANSTKPLNVTFSIPSEREAEPQLVLAEAQFTGKNKGIIATNQPINFTISLSNEGKAIAQNVRVKFSFPYKVNALSKKLLKIGDLKPNESKELTFSFQAETVYLDDKIPIGCRVMESSSKFGTEASFTINLENTERETATVELPVKQQFTIINWSNPNPDLHQTEHLNWEKSNIPITLIANSTDELTNEHFEIFRNGETLKNSGAKLDKVQLSKRKKSDAENNHFSYTFTNQIPLLEGVNEIYMKVKNQAGEAVSEKLYIDYAPAKPNLFLLSVGVPQIDLQFTRKDATDFAQAFDNQADGLFHKIAYKKVLNKPKNTTKRAISFAMSEIERAAENDQLLEKDVLVLFFSTHGMTDKKWDSYLLHPSDVDLLDRGTFVNFQTDILDRLARIDCKKFVFIDACRTEFNNNDGAKSSNYTDIEEAIYNLVSASGDIKTMLSCNQGETSYEDEKWQNGAFTKAIVEGLNNVPFKVNNKEIVTDINADNILTFNELYQYIRAKVNLLVKAKNKKYRQTPTLPNQHQLQDLPIYFVKE